MTESPASTRLASVIEEEFRGRIEPDSCTTRCTKSSVYCRGDGGDDSLVRDHGRCLGVFREALDESLQWARDKYLTLTEGP